MIYLEIDDNSDVLLRDDSDGRVVARGALVADTPPGAWSAPEGEFRVSLSFIGTGTGPAK